MKSVNKAINQSEIKGFSGLWLGFGGGGLGRGGAGMVHSNT